MGLLFTWNDRKAADNERKHGGTFEEAVTVFADTLAGTIPDPVHSVGEDREIIIGLSHRNHILVVVFTERGHNIRIISARRATRRERKTYEEAF